MNETNIVQPVIENHTLETAANQIESVLHLPVPILLILVLNGIAIIVRRSRLHNWTISLIIIALGTVTYPMLSSPANTVFKATGNYVLYLQGALLSLAALGADLFLEKFAWYRSFTKSISEDKVIAEAVIKAEAVEKDIKNNLK